METCLKSSMISERDMAVTEMELQGFKEPYLVLKRCFTKNHSSTSEKWISQDKITNPITMRFITEDLGLKSYAVEYSHLIKEVLMLTRLEREVRIYLLNWVMFHKFGLDIL